MVKGKPPVTCGSDNAAYLGVRDDWNSNWIGRVLGNTWTGWHYGGSVTSVDPQVAALGGTVGVIVLDNWGALWRSSFTEGIGNGWQTWTYVGGVWQDLASAASGGELLLAGRSPSNELWWWRQSGNQWTWLGYAGVAAGHLSAAPR